MTDELVPGVHMAEDPIIPNNAALNSTLTSDM